MKLLRNVSVKISCKSLKIALVPPRRRGQPCSFNMYSTADYVGMLKIYGECGRNAGEAARVYAQRFPNRNYPDYKTILSVIARNEYIFRKLLYIEP
jgi:hypothetical protein